MKHLVLILGLIFARPAVAQSRAVGQPTVTRSIPKNVLTYTTAAVQLYVDPTGSDLNPCTATGTAACLTLQGAFNKIPKGLRHRATVTVAAGNYAGVTISGFVVDPGFQKTTAGILFEGALANVTPTTGSATGTATSGTAGSGVTFGTLTDTGATWTASDAAILGKLIVITGGTGSGQVKVITANTGTVLTIAGTWTAPDATSTYAIQSPSAVITSKATAVPGFFSGNFVETAGIQVIGPSEGHDSTLYMSVGMKNIGINVTGGPDVSVVGASVFFNQVVSVNTTANGILAYASSAVSLDTCSLTGTSGGRLQLASYSQGFITNSLFVGTSGTRINVGENATIVNLTGSQLTGTVGLQVLGGAASSVTNIRCDCLSIANSACLVAGIAPAIVAASNAVRNSALAFIAVNSTNCTTGAFAATGGGITGSSTAVLSGNALTYAVNTFQGGYIVIPTATTTITGGTAEMSVDTGAATAAFSTLPASFDCLTNLATLSSVCRL